MTRLTLMRTTFFGPRYAPLERARTTHVVGEKNL